MSTTARSKGKGSAEPPGPATTGTLDTTTSVQPGGRGGRKATTVPSAAASSVQDGMLAAETTTTTTTTTSTATGRGNERYRDPRDGLPFSTAQPLITDPALWGLDPLFWTAVKVCIGQLERMPSVPNLPETLVFYDHVIERIEIVGYIIMRDRRAAFARYLVDDGTGVVPVLLWLSQSPAFAAYADDPDTLGLGSLVRIQGRVSVFRNTRQVNASSVVILKDPNAEIVFWLECIQLAREVYSKPPKLPTAFDSVSHNSPLSLNQQESATATIDGDSDDNGEQGPAAPPEHPPAKEPLSESSLPNAIMSELVKRGLFRVQYQELLAAMAGEADVLVQSVAAARSGEGTAVSESLLEEVRHTLFARALNSLKQQGRLYLADEISDTYEMITLETHIVPFVLSEVRAKGEMYGGVSFDAVYAASQSDRNLHRVPRSRISAAVEALLSRSEIYEVANRVYKPVFG